MYLKITPLCISVGCWPLVDQTKAIFFLRNNSYMVSWPYPRVHLPKHMYLYRCHDNSKGRRIWRVVFLGFFLGNFSSRQKFSNSVLLRRKDAILFKFFNFFFILSLIHLTSSTQEVICCTWYDLKAFQLHLTIR